MEGNTLKPKSEVTNVAYGSVPIATGGSNGLIDRLEKMMWTILKKIDDKTPSQSSNPLTKSSQPDICLFCNKSDHVGSKYFKRRKCYTCRKIRHIAKFCIENQQSSNVASFENTGPNSRPAQGTKVNVEIGGKNVELLYNSGSQFSIITKQAYGYLSCKPSLVEVKHSGIGTDGHIFTFEGVAYLTLNFKKSDGAYYTLLYEPKLFARCSLLVTFCSLLVTFSRCSLLFARCSLRLARCSLLFDRYYLLVARYFLLVAYHFLFVARYFFIQITVK